MRNMSCFELTHTCFRPNTTWSQAVLINEGNFVTHTRRPVTDIHLVLTRQMIDNLARGLQKRCSKTVQYALRYPDYWQSSIVSSATPPDDKSTRLRSRWCGENVGRESILCGKCFSCCFLSNVKHHLLWPWARALWASRAWNHIFNPKYDSIK